jgi:hypothetical protein
MLDKELLEYALRSLSPQSIPSLDESFPSLDESTLSPPYSPVTSSALLDDDSDDEDGIHHHREVVAAACGVHQQKQSCDVSPWMCVYDLDDEQDELLKFPDLQQVYDSGLLPYVLDWFTPTPVAAWHGHMPLPEESDVNKGYPLRRRSSSDSSGSRDRGAPPTTVYCSQSCGAFETILAVRIIYPIGLYRMHFMFAHSCLFFYTGTTTESSDTSTAD